MLHRLLLSTILAFGVVASAAAADLPSEKGPPAYEPPPPPAFSWTGFYIGANGGYGWSTTTWVYPTTNYYDTGAGQGYTANPDGALAGGQIGYNLQFGSWVVGIEGSGDWADLRETRLGAVTATFPNDSYSTKITDIESITGRLGYAFNTWLLYAKGGVATTNLGLNIVSGAPGAGVTTTNDQRLWGPTVGGGVEYAITDNIVAGVEFDYSYFHKGGISTVTTGPVAAPVTINGGGVDVESVLARISYKFDFAPPPAPPVVAKY
jgi:outer membrane immunogenic protein